MELTAKQVEQAGTGKGKALAPGRHHDGNSLYLEVRKATSKSFSGRYTLNGKEIWIGCGSAKGDGALKRARDKHTENQRLIAEGIDPRDHRRQKQVAAAVAAAKVVTFEEMGERVIAVHDVEWTNDQHRQQWRNTLRDYVYPHIGALPVQAIDIALAARVFQQPMDGTTFWLARPVTASRTRGRCEQIMDAAKAQKLCSENPFEWKTLKHLLPAKTKIHKVEHHPAVPHPEMPRLMGELRARTSISAKTLEFTILTTSRVNQVVLAYGREFDLANARWKVPAEHMKGRQSHTVMLSKRAVEIVRELHPDGLKPDKLVFGVSHSALRKMLALAGYGDATVHGTARASFKTWCDECTAFKDAVSEACLAHIEGDKVKAAYARGQFEKERAELMEMWSRHCLSEPIDTSNNVVSLRGT
jgi:integrase